MHLSDGRRGSSWCGPAGKCQVKRGGPHNKKSCRSVALSFDALTQINKQCLQTSVAVTQKTRVPKEELIRLWVQYSVPVLTDWRSGAQPACHQSPSGAVMGGVLHARRPARSGSRRGVPSAQYNVGKCVCAVVHLCLLRVKPQLVATVTVGQTGRKGIRIARIPRSRP
jgi:hypothetical protein